MLHRPALLGQTGSTGSTRNDGCPSLWCTALVAVWMSAAVSFCEDRVAAVGVADTARKIAAGDIHLQAAPGAKGVMDYRRDESLPDRPGQAPTAAVRPPRRNTSPAPPCP